MKTLAIIPARMESTRFPGKPLAKLNGRTVLEWIWRAASDAKRVNDILIATDSLQIQAAAHAFGGRTAITSKTCRSGTERTAEARAGQPHEIVLDIQADEPLLRAETIDLLIEAMTGPGQPEMATVVTPRSGKPEFRDPNRVKVVLDRTGYALYFSRSPIPTLPNGNIYFLQHVGIYAFRSDILRRIAYALPAGPLELAEGLEQLRALENGIRIKTIRASYPMASIDTPDDIPRAAALLKSVQRALTGADPK